MICEAANVGEERAVGDVAPVGSGRHAGVAEAPDDADVGGLVGVEAQIDAVVVRGVREIADLGGVHVVGLRGRDVKGGGVAVHCGIAAGDVDIVVRIVRQIADIRKERHVSHKAPIQ